MRKIFTVTIVFALAIAFSSCATRKVSRVNTNEVIDLSGRWNDTDSQLVSAEMIDDLLGARWLPVYESQHNNKRPVVVVGTVTNKSHEHINSETFIKDIEKAIIKNGSVRLVQAGEKRQELRTERDEQNQGYTSPETAKKWGLELGADFMLQGTINSIVDSYKKEQVVYYQVDLELTNLETNEVEIRKSKNKLATEPCKRKATQILILDLRFSIDHLRTVSCNVIHRKSQIKNSK
jgi:uncharacterized protein (TIGR02722 family)